MKYLTQCTNCIPVLHNGEHYHESGCEVAVKLQEEAEEEDCEYEWEAYTGI